jgi:Peptidase MA superfamily
LRKLLVVVLALAVAMLTVASPRPQAHAQQAIVVQSDEPHNDFPLGVTFGVTFNAPAAPKEVRIQYSIAPDGTGATAVSACTGDATISCSFKLSSTLGIIPGAAITYHWNIEDIAGDKLSTQDKLYVHQDNRFDFRTLQKENLTLYYYSGSDASAQAVLDAAADSLDKTSALEQVQVTFPVKVFMYRTAGDMQPAIAVGGRSPGVQILGEVVYSDTAMVSVDNAPLDVTRHEVAHIVTGVATKGPFGIASWLNEGISVFSQSHILDSEQSALDDAIARDRVLSMKELNSSASGRSGSTVSLFYAESGAIVKFLVDTYGPDKFAQLLKVFKDGSTPDDAFKSVYGIDQLGIENAWRQSVGLQPRTAAEATAPAATSPASPSQPTSSAARSGTSSSAKSSGGGSHTVLVTLIVVLALVAAALAAGGVVIVRRRL